MTNSLQTLINDISNINKLIKKHQLKTEINIDHILEKILNKEKEYNVIKYNLNTCKNNLEDNLKLLQQKCDIEYKIYEIVMEHKNKLNNLKEKHKMEIPNLDNFIENLFNINISNLKTSNKKESNIKNSNDNGNSNEPKKKLNAGILQDQLNAAIMSRRSAINPE